MPRDRLGPDAGKACRVETHRDQLRSARRALAVPVAEVHQHIGFAREPHVAQQRADEQRMLGRERPRPIAKPRCMSRDGHTEQPRRVPGVPSPRCRRRSRRRRRAAGLGLDPCARRLLDIVLVRDECASARRTSHDPRFGLRLSCAACSSAARERRGRSDGSTRYFIPRRSVSGITAVACACQCHL